MPTNSCCPKVEETDRNCNKINRLQMLRPQLTRSHVCFHYLNTQEFNLEMQFGLVANASELEGKKERKLEMVSNRPASQ